MAQKLSETNNYEQYMDDSNWVAELKRDGNYLEIEYQNNEFTFFNRNGDKFTKDISKSILESLETFKTDDYAKSFRLAGELVYVSKDGKDHRTQAQCKDAIPYFMAFELLILNDEDITKLTWKERKHELTQLFFIYDLQPSKGSNVILIPHYMDKRGLYNFAKEIGLEGIVLKHIDGEYVEGKNPLCIKVKFTLTDEYIVIGYALATEFSINRKGETIKNKRFPTFGALCLAKYKPVFTSDNDLNNIPDDFELVPMGRVGGGFTDKDLLEVTPLLKKDQYYQDNVNLSGLTDKDYRYAKGKVNWLNPLDYFVVEVKMSMLTEYGKPFQPRFLAIRDDKKPSECMIIK